MCPEKSRVKPFLNTLLSDGCTEVQLFAQQQNLKSTLLIFGFLPPLPLAWIIASDLCSKTVIQSSGLIFPPGQSHWLFCTSTRTTYHKECILNQLAKKTVSIIITVALITGCAGRTPNPVPVNQYGDANRSCKAIEGELSFIDAEVSRLLPASDKTAKNVALGIAGRFLLCLGSLWILARRNRRKLMRYGKDTII